MTCGNHRHTRIGDRRGVPYLFLLKLASVSFYPTHSSFFFTGKIWLYFAAAVWKRSKRREGEKGETEKNKFLKYL